VKRKLAIANTQGRGRIATMGAWSSENGLQWLKYRLQK
jgi:hypothetical protein